MNIFELLKVKEYPGRFLLLGMVEGGYIAIYGVTARSAASRAKRYIWKPEKRLVTVEATDADVMAQGDLSLLQYNPVYFFDNGIVIGNGRQTDRIQFLNAPTAGEQLSFSLQEETFEVDKYNTPRITGCILQKENTTTMALHIIRSNENNMPVRDVYGVTLENGKGKYISTYNGPNIRPTPSFVGSAQEVELSYSSLEDFVHQVYLSLAPKEGEKDARVSVVGVFLNLNLTEKKVFILNKVDEVV